MGGCLRAGVRRGWVMEGVGHAGKRLDKGRRGGVGSGCIGFFFNDTATTEIYTLSLHDALPISPNIYPSSFSHFLS